MFDSQLGDRLHKRLSSGLPLPRSTISPKLSYGRHRGPATRASRIAAVVVALYQDSEGQWTVPLTLRPTSLQHHGGQISLPGGRVEANEDIISAAMREYEEELGIAPVIRQVCGQLSTQYVYASDNLVHPVVVVVDRPSSNWKPDPIEVAEVIPVPLDVLLDPRCRTELIKRRNVRSDGRVVGEMAFRARAIQHGDHMIWGATGLMLDQLAQLLR